MELPMSSNRGRCSPAKGLIRRGLTLVEVLIATVLAMLLLMSLASAFKKVGDSITENRAALQMSNQLRAVSSLLRRDLEMATVKPNPPMLAASPMGYFKIYEGPTSDFSAKLYLEAANPGAGRFGDFDDILMFTASASGEWFTGKVPRYIAEKRNPTNPTPYDLEPVVIGSKYAEVIWYTSPLALDSTGLPTKLQLHRRVLLIRPDLNGSSGVLALGTTTLPAAYQTCDLSMHRIANGRVVANTLEDLMYLENRFAHIQVSAQSHLSMPILDLGTAVPFAQGASSFGSIPARSGLLNGNYILQGDRQGEDVVMSDCVAFDLKVFDREVPLYGVGTGAAGTDSMVLSPNDPGYAAAISSAPVGSGDFVDLGWYRNVAPMVTNAVPPRLFVGFSGFRNHGTNSFSFNLLKSGMVVIGGWSQISYDSWTTGYELDGRLQGDLSGGLAPQTGTVQLSSTTAARTNVDIGTNGVDDDANGLIDDFLEWETSAPFPIVLPSVQATIRLEEPDTRQLQQVSVVSEFLTK